MKTLQTADLELLVDSAHGIYIPKLYWESYKLYHTNLNQEDFDYFLADPSNEGYWDAWDELLSDTIINDNGQRTNLIQLEGDVFAIPEEQCELINWEEV